MNVRRWLCVSLLLAFGSATAAETLSHGRFEQLEIYRPHGEARQMVLFFSGERGWDAELEPIAQSLARQGALVVGIDSPALFRNLEQDDGCVNPDGDLENLSHFLQAYYRLPGYRPALLVGAASGSAFVHAMLTQAPAGTFSGGISLGFCPVMPLRKPLCPNDSAGKPSAKLHAAAKLGAPWTVLQGLNDRSCQAAAKQFLAKVGGAEIVSVPGDDYGDGDFHTWESQFAAAYQKIAAQAPAPLKVGASELSDLPLVEVPATGAGDTLALLISGDGGWAGIDKELAAEISKQGVPVVGLDSLRYFWKERTPESTTADVERILRYYLAAWNKRAVLLIGFSQGADVMPFVVNRLSAATRARLQLVTLLSLSQTAVFEFHLQNWLGGSDEEVPVAPEVAKMSGVRALCVYGEDDDESMCIQPEAKPLQVVKLKGGHHFDGDYPSLAQLILARARRSADSRL
jgi:type IV secretory pathway VirJ component